MSQLTRRQEIVLAALATDPDALFGPAQVQKMFFLLDEKIHEELGGKQFKFEPYHYGPFDKDVYVELEALERKGLVIINGESCRQYRLTPSGYLAGVEILGDFCERAQKYMSKLSKWILKLSFAELVGSIYKAYPDMRKNSIFQD